METCGQSHEERFISIASYSLAAERCDNFNCHSLTCSSSLVDYMITMLFDKFIDNPL